MLAYFFVRHLTCLSINDKKGKDIMSTTVAIQNQIPCKIRFDLKQFLKNCLACKLYCHLHGGTNEEFGMLIPLPGKLRKSGEQFSLFVHVLDSKFSLFVLNSREDITSYALIVWICREHFQKQTNKQTDFCSI